MADHVPFDENPFTGCYDEDGRELRIGQAVTFLGHPGTVAFEYGAYGIAFPSERPIDWAEVKREIGSAAGCLDRPSACMNDHFVSFWEIAWNFGGEENLVPRVRATAD